jgi:hypothetical protein
MLMADPAAALSETRRVLMEGGPLAFAVWATPDRNPWASIPAGPTPNAARRPERRRRHSGSLRVPA